MQTLNRNIASAGEELQPFHTVISSLYKQVKSLGDDFNSGICIWNLLLKKSNGSALGYKNKTNLERGSGSSVHSDKKKKKKEKNALGKFGKKKQMMNSFERKYRKNPCFSPRVQDLRQSLLAKEPQQDIKEFNLQLHQFASLKIGVSV